MSNQKNVQKIVDALKGVGVKVMAIEKACGFFNGKLGQVIKGKAPMSDSHYALLLEFYEGKLGAFVPDAPDPNKADLDELAKSTPIATTENSGIIAEMKANTDEKLKKIGIDPHITKFGETDEMKEMINHVKSQPDINDMIKKELAEKDPNLFPDCLDNIKVAPLKNDQNKEDLVNLHLTYATDNKVDTNISIPSISQNDTLDSTPVTPPQSTKATAAPKITEEEILKNLKKYN